MRLSGFLVFFCLACTVVDANPPALHYIQNKGQWPDAILYRADIPGGNFYLTPAGFSYLFYDTENINWRHHGLERQEDVIVKRGWSEDSQKNNLKLHMFHAEFVGGNLQQVTHGDQLNTKFNYYYGDDPTHWASDVKGYYDLRVQNVYDNIDIKISSQAYNLKYDIIAKTGANPSDIRIRYRGVDDIDVMGTDLVVTTSVNKITEYRPYAYQVIDGKQVEVVCEYHLEGSVLSFNFPLGYNECYDLVIDPLLIFSTYSGSAADNWGNTATYGEHGKLYSGGITNHMRDGSYLGEFPATEGAYQTEYGGDWDLAIIKYDSAGHNVEYATYLGGSASEVPVSMIMNSKEELLIYGVTNSTDFPTTGGAYQTSFQGGSAIGTILGESFKNGSDSFIVKLSKDGSQLLSSTYFGGNGNDGLNESSGALTKNYGDQQRGEIFLDENDDVYVVGSTSSTDLFNDPSINSFSSIYRGGPSDALVAKFNSNLSQLLWGGYLGGSGTDTGFAIKVDSKKDVFVAGGTNSNNFNLVNHPEPYHGNIDGWIARISADSLKVNSGVYLGTPNYDQIYFLDLDSNEEIYVLGQTTGDFPISGNVYSNPGGGQFIQKLSNDLSSTGFSTVFGTIGRHLPNISPTAFLVNDCNNLYVAGWGNTQGNFRGYNYLPLNTSGLPVTTDALKKTTTGDDFYLMVLDANASSLLYATFFGGDEALVHVDGGTSRFDKSGIVYHSVCASCAGGSSFPTTDGAWSNENGAHTGCNNAAFKFDLASLRAIIQTNNLKLTSPGYNKVCYPDSIVFQNLSIGGEVFEWDFGDGSTFTKTDTAYFVYNYKAPGTYKVILKAIDPNTCIAEDETFTMVTVLDPKQKARDDAAICWGDDLTLTATGGTSYHWVSADSTFASDQARPTITPEDTTTYYVSIEDANCETLDTVVVNVIPEVKFDFSLEKVYDCKSRPTLKVVNDSTEGPYLWDMGDGNTIAESDFVYDYNQDGDYTVKLVGTNDKCMFVRETPVHIETIRVPNVFTPSDGEPNAVFEVVSDSREEVKIFDRWGKLVYENKDYKDDWTGEKVAAGVYYYLVLVDEETTCTGWVHVLK